MVVALEKFVKQLEDSGIVAPGKLENFVPPKAHPKDAEELARQLVKADHLTPFQAQHVLLGKVKALFLGNYTVLDKIGAGGMGQVFKAEHRRMKRVVAIKMLPPAVTKNAVATARFQREVEAASKLLHPNIVSAFDADEANGAHFLVMEYVEGKDLSAHVKKNGPFSVDKAVNYILQSARGLEFAHAEGVIHRDIKPANLLLDKKGVVKILDMGLARIDAPRGDQAAQAELTGTGAIMGTVDYMAPEQGVSTKDADARADIYSLGCTLHYLLIGKPVYGGDSVGAKFLAHHNQPIPNLCTLREDMPEQVNAVFRKMVAKKISDRYQTMTEVVAGLQACGVGHDQSLTMQRSISLDADNSALTFLKNIPPATTHRPRPTKKTNSGGSGNVKKKLIYGAFGAGLLGILTVAGILISLPTRDGTQIVKFDQPDTLVPVKPEAGQSNQPWDTPAFQQWIKTVVAMPAEKQVEAVGKKLIELNPGFDGKITRADGQGPPRIEGGVVTELRMISPSMVDLSPVRALPGLNLLHYYAGSGATSRLSDLSPLEGMRISNLSFNGAIVSNLSALRGMPLTNLYCSYTRVSDLSPLNGMPLIELDCHNTQVSDLSPLRGMRLKNLDVGNDVSISDLSPLEGMPLTTLSVSQTAVSDFSPLRGMSLSYLLLTPKNITKGLDVIRQMGSLTTIGTGGYDKCSAAEFWKKYDAGEFGKPTAPSKLAFLDPAFQRWMKDVQALPAEQQIEAVAKKLVELNPKFDGKVTGPYGKGIPKIENGVVTQLEFNTEDVTDISPVRALAGLKSLSCAGGPGRRGKLADLSPLRGLSLTKLYFNSTKVSDLSPLTGMKLTEVGCSYTNANDLAPLRGMPLSYVTCGSLRDLWDLSPLMGAPLTKLECYSCGVSDLAPLADMPLVSLNVGGTKVSDLTPLRRLPLSYLVFNDTPVSDVSSLKDVKLTEIAFTPRNITKGIDALRGIKSLLGIGVRGDRDSFISPAEFWKKYDAGEFGKPAKLAYLDPAFQQWMKTVAAQPAEKQVDAVAKKLQELNPGFDGQVVGFDGKPKVAIEAGVVTEFGIVTDDVTDISPVKALVALKCLSCCGSGSGRAGKLSDLSPLQGLKLTKLHFFNTAVSNLTPLQGMPLTRLACNQTQVSNLLPLMTMPLSILNCDSSMVFDLSPLETCRNLQHLKCHNTRVTPATVAALQKALPNCKIEWDDPAKPKKLEPAGAGTK